MARTGVNFNDIKKAAETINARGENPTVDRVREELGTGSKSTIAPLLKTWRSEFEQETDAITLPRELLKAVKVLNDYMQLQANEKIEESTKSFELTADKLRQTLASQTSRIAELEADERKNKEHAQAVETENTALKNKIEALQQTLDKKQATLDTANEKNTALTLDLGELKSENKDIRSHFEHYQESTAENQRQEREQFKQANSQLHYQLDQANQQHLLAEKKSQAYFNANAELQSKLDDASAENKSLSIDSATLKAQAQTAAEALQREKSSTKRLSHENEDIKRILSGVKAAHKQAEIALIKADKDIEGLTKRLQQETDAKALLSDQKNEALQENAMILGQLKQLQTTL